MNTHKHILVYISSSVTLFGLFWICIFGDWHTVNALGDDSSIYLVDFDETAYDLYLKGYYPSDYTYADFRRDSIESMTSHYVATDSNNFSAIVDTIEQDVLQNGWSVIDNFFENAWINLKTGDITVAQGFTDDFKHELDGRFKTSPTVGGQFQINGHVWTTVPYTSSTNSSIVRIGNSWDSPLDVYATSAGGYTVLAGYYTSSDVSGYTLFVNSTTSDGRTTGTYTYDNVTYRAGRISSQRYPLVCGSSQYSNYSSALADFYGNFSSDLLPSGQPDWNGTGYYSDTPTNYNINLPALPAINWPSISTNNKTKYGVDFPNIDLTVDFQLPDSYYPQTVTYDVPYWLYNTDSTPVDWQNVSFDDVTLPEVQLSDGDGSFFQALFNTLPLAFVPILLGVILCYLIFLML